MQVGLTVNCEVILQLISFIISPVYLSELCFPYFLIAADKSHRKETNTRRLCLCAGMWMSHVHKYLQMTKCVYMCDCTCFPGRKHLLQGVRGHLSDSVLQEHSSRWLTSLQNWSTVCTSWSFSGRICRDTAVLLDLPTAHHLRQCRFALFRILKQEEIFSACWR